MNGDNERFDVDRLLCESAKLVMRECVICGEQTDCQFYGQPCCEVYDEDGRIRKNCKYHLRRQVGDTEGDIPRVHRMYR